MKYRFVLLLVLSCPGFSQLCAPSGSLAPSSKLTATLDANNCALPDGTWFADYRIDFPTRGAWMATSSSFNLILRDASGGKLETGTSIRHNVERGTYHLIVNANSPNEGGSFDLATSFTPAAGVLCYNFPLLDSFKPTSGTLGSGSCTLPDASVYDGYQLTVYGTGTVDLAVSASNFTPLVILRSSNGAALGSANTADDSGVVHLVLPELGNDTYTIVVAVSTPDQTGGTYSVSANFTPDDGEICVSQASLISQQYTGSISSSSCTLGDNPSPFNFYTIHTDKPGLLQANLSSTDFSSLLLLLDGAGNPVAQDPITLRHQLPAGDYRLLIYNEESATGGYTLDYQFNPAAAPVCPVTPIDPAAPISGTLSNASSCLDGDLLSDLYAFTLPADGTVTLSLTSPDFAPLLDLRDAKGNTMTWAGESLALDLPAGTYYLHAASNDNPGVYILAASFTPKTLAMCAGPTLMPPNGFIHNAQLGESSCLSGDGRRADFYRFTLSQPATQAVFMTSDAVPTDLALFQQDGTLLRTDQDSYIDDNAAIVQYLPAGTYQIRARSADPALQGRYNLDLLFVPGPAPTLCAPKSLPVNTSVSGSTFITSCAWADKTFADVYRLQVSDASQVASLSARSTSFDTFLILLDAKGNVIGADATLQQTLDPGEYFVVVKPANDPTSAGPYVLSCSLAPVPVVSQENESEKSH